MNSQKSLTHRATSWTSYPVVMAVGLVSHYLLLQQGISVEISAVIAVLIGALFVTTLEYTLPYRREWHPNGSEFANDAVYMIVVQIFLPRLLAFLIAVTALQYLEARELTLNTFWPHHLPIYAQTILMLLIADFFRYWVHRAHHRYPLLWRFHAVHHSPHKLYWVNVGRFHPVDKILQQLVETAPFILLGISEYVIAAYFVFYAINGFFQHCNIDVRLGFLNYVISGPELHHWHHSASMEEAIKNLGNNLIVWDLLFGTWYLPKDRKVGPLGVPEENYPQDFLHQQVAPFTHKGF